MAESDFCSRRQVLTVAGGGIVSVLAGCSGSGEPNSPTPTTQRNDDDTPTPDQTAPQTTADSTQSRTVTQQDSDGTDFQYTGESVVEQQLLDASFEFVELEQTSEQLSYPLSTLYAQNVDYRAELIQDIHYDTMFLGVRKAEWSSASPVLLQGYLVADRWEGETLEENVQDAYFSATTRIQEVEMGFADVFRQDVNGYDDVSDDFPEEYRTLIDDTDA